MRDLIHLYDEPARPNTGMIQQGLLAAVFVVLVGLCCWSFIEALTKEADIAHAVAQARKKERERIYTANMDILAGHDGYIRQVEALIEQEYRREAK